MVTQAVFSTVREIYGREHDDPMNDLDVNMAIWGIFLNATLRAAVHLGQDYEVNLRCAKKNLWNSVRQIFRETGKLISDQNEITCFRTLVFQDATWMQTSLLCDKAFQITNTKAYVFSDSVLCVGKMGDDPLATWKSKIKWYSENKHFRDMNRIDGMPTEFEWEIFPGITALGLLDKPDGHKKWWQISLHLVIRYFVPPVPLREENYEAKEGKKKSIRFNGSHETIELLLRTVISANQLSIYAAIAGLCDQVPKSIRAPGKPAAPKQ